MRRDILATVLIFGTMMAGCTVHHHYPPPAAPPSDATEDGVSECAPLLPAPDSISGHDASSESAHPHPHDHPRPASESHPVAEGEARVISHADLQKFENDGTVLVGLATAGLGASSFEVWRSSVPPGGATPLHVHETEEVFVVLRGKGVLIVGDESMDFEAPATVIAPARVPHQLRNTGTEPTDQIVIVGVGSEIKNDAGKVMQLPWRK